VPARNGSKAWTAEAAQKPESLLARVILPRRPDDLVLDPFSGTGTTGSSLLLRRRFIGFERAAAYQLRRASVRRSSHCPTRARS
jgi:DNA modification methylase